ncbi:MAG: metallophosphoesterase [Clostridiales bacterium]|nr:metallophosphoesterase [Clostridiales bacterium]
MRVLIVSDTHRQHESLKKVLKKEENIDMLIHLGDVEGYEEYIKELAGCPVEMVAGNNDFFSSLDKEKEIHIGRYKVLLTHGHYYYVSMETSVIKMEAYSRGCDIVMYGHTHKPVVEYDLGIIALNPGSLSYPRQKNRKPSYIIMEIDEKGNARFAIHYLD